MATSQLSLAEPQSLWTSSQLSSAGAATATVATSQLDAAVSQLAAGAALSQLGWAAVEQLLSALPPARRADSLQLPDSWTSTATATVAVSQEEALAESQSLAVFLLSQVGSWTGTATATWATFFSAPVMRSHQPRFWAGALATALAEVSQLVAAVSQAAWAACSVHSDLATALDSLQPASWAEAWPANGARRRARTRSCLMLGGWS